MHICTYINIYGELLEDPRELQELSSAIAANTTVTSIVVNHLQLKKPIAEAFYKALQSNQSVTFLDLSMTRLNNETLRGFRLLTRNQNIKTLVLQHNSLGDVGMLYLTDVLMTNTTITSLDISFNNYGAFGAALLTRSLSANKTLLSLGLRGNCTSENVSGISSLIEGSPYLKELDVSAGSSATSPSTVGVVLEALRQLRRSNRTYSYSDINCGLISENDDKELKSFLSKGDNNKGSVTLEDGTLIKLENANIPPTSSNIVSLNLSRTDIATIPLHLFGDEFLSLRSLSLDNNRISGKLPSQLSRLTNLMHLDLHSNKITMIPTSISELNQLAVLDLRWNEIQQIGIPPSVFFLSSLRTLRLQGNPIDGLPVDLYTIPNTLDVHAESTLVPRGLQLVLFAKYQHMTTLVVPRFHLKALPTEIGILTTLRSIDLSYNALMVLPVEIGNLSQLRRLDLRCNELRNLPWTIGHLPKLKELLLKGNPFSELPSELLQQKTEHIKTFLKSLQSGEVSCSRVKVLVVGEENVGKTALIECLHEFNNSSDTKSSSIAKTASTTSTANMTSLSTDGIAIRSLMVDSTLRFSVWDFAGQQVYYSSHHLFITNDSLFLLVFNLAEANPFERVRYWLQVSAFTI